eukprot:COSAG02_NODE_14183_length_1299_cov_8.839167_1_plen_44_part_10
MALEMAGQPLKRDDDDDGTGGSFRNPDRLQLIVMPTLTVVATVA